MAIDQQTPSSRSTAYPKRSVAGQLTAGGSTGNERLTAATGAVLIVLLAIIGITLLRLRPLLSVHLFVGLALIPPVLLKLASTGYRFIRYYTNNPVYRRKGPPPTVLRMIAPMVILTTAIVFASGVALLFVGPSSRDTLLPIHKVSFIIWVGFTALHVLGHLLELPPALSGDYTRAGQLSSDVTGRFGRMLSLSGALVAGVVLAIVLIPQYGAWLNSSSVFFNH
jgi:hypothetical protein